MFKIKKILMNVLAIALLLNTTMVFAKITPEEARSEEYLINQGYSKEAARLINVSHNHATGTAKEDNDNNKSMMWPVRMLKKFHAYLDPAVDEGGFGNEDVDFQLAPEYKLTPDL